MKQLVYAFFITLLILNIKIKTSYFNVCLLVFLIIIIINKKLWPSLMVGASLGLLLNPSLKKNEFDQNITGLVNRRTSNSFVLQTSKSKILVFSKSKPKRNTKIILQGRVNEIKNDNNNNFDFKTYWNSKGIKYQISNPDIISFKADNHQDDYLKSWFNLVFLNEKSETIKPVYKSLQELGLAHLVVISSFHITLIYSLLYFLGKNLRFLIVLLFCWYLGFPAPAIKALIYLFLSTLLPKNSALDNLSITGFIILILQPYAARDFSFILTMIFSTSIFLFLKDTTKLQKILSLRMIGSYIQWTSTSSIYLLSFISIIFSPLIFVIYLSVLLRQKWILKILEKAIIKFNEINIPLVLGQNKFIVVLILVLIILLIRNMSLKNKSIKLPLISVVTCFSLLKYYLQSLSFVTFLNVGQGDAALIKIKNKSYLIDVGKPTKFNNVIKPYLFKNGISQIENVYISHSHNDHDGGLSDDWKGLKIKNNKSPHIKQLNKFNWKNENNNSEVLLFSYGSKTFLFTGDIEKRVEKSLIPDINNHIRGNVDYLKVAHHGSNTSSDPEFIDAISPGLAIISVGKNNYNHPHPEVINTFESHNIKILQTLKEGHIKIML